MPVRKWAWVASSTAVIALTSGAFMWVGDQPRVMDDRPEVVVDALETVEFDSAEQMAVTSVKVVRATVTAVGPGRITGEDEVTEPGEAPPTTQARDVTLTVTDDLKKPGVNPWADPITVEEWGWDSEGRGYQVNNYSWSEVGEEYIFFLTWGEPIGSNRWSVISTEGRAHIGENENLTSSAEVGSALGIAMQNHSAWTLTRTLEKLFDKSTPPEDRPQPADMPEPAPSGYGESPVPDVNDSPIPGVSEGGEPFPSATKSDLGTGDGSE
ncbi:hypothetical protein ACIBCU_04945 [Streptomyces sp. NPDC051064]|uniref:hypothetical protein n=1 Tax=Streptomyces sp. NPDC051064 TaxID=3365641 RepID=UPI0037AC1CFE